jgi:glutamate dehydrogenase
VIAERKQAGRGLVSPELAVLMAHCKIFLYAQLLESDLPEDPYLSHDLERYFPAPLPERYRTEMREHRLRREIIATVVANQLVDRAGTTFAYRLGEETGGPAQALARAYAVAREVFGMREFWNEVEALDNEVAARTQLEMLTQGRRLVERSARWLVRRNPEGIEIANTVRHFAPGAEALWGALPNILEEADRASFDAREAELLEAGVPAAFAVRVASMPSMFSALDIVDVANETGRSLKAVTVAYFELGCRLQLNWLRDRIVELPRANRWQALARAALRDDLYSLHGASPAKRSRRRGQRRRLGSGRRGDRRVDETPRRRRRALPRHARRHQGLAELRHDDAAGRAARGAKPDRRRSLR